MTEAPWRVLATAPNVPSAHAIATLLESHGVACQIKADTVIPGEARSCAILVDASVMHRAQWVLSEARLTDAELEFLATGMLCCDDAREKP